MGSVKKVAENIVEAPVDLVKSAVKGDIKGIADSALRVGSFGTVGIEKGGIANAKTLMGKTPKITDTGNQAELEKQADKTSKQRQALFMTEGDILGEEVEGVGKKKRGNILGN